MSGTRSIRKMITRIDRESMRTDQPVSASTTLLARNALQHAVDVSCQYRVSWAASTSTNETDGDGSETRTYHAWEFPVTVTDNETVPSMHIQITGRLNHASVPDGAIRARLVGGDNLDLELWRDEWTITGTSPTAHVTIVDLDYDWRLVNRRLAYLDDTGGIVLTATPITYARLMLFVETISGDDELGGCQLTNVHVREYLV
jgi:hypothetical protein